MKTMAELRRHIETLRKKQEKVHSAIQQSHRELQTRCKHVRKEQHESYDEDTYGKTIYSWKHVTEVCLGCDVKWYWNESQQSGSRNWEISGTVNEVRIPDPRNETYD